MTFNSRATSGTAGRQSGAQCSISRASRCTALQMRSLRPLFKQAYTLVEVMVVTALLAVLAVTVASSIYTGRMTTRRLADYTAAMAVVQAKVEDIRAATYNPPTSPFTSAPVVLTGTSSIALNQAGTTFVVAGTVTSRIEPVTSGHLVTVTGTFQTRRRPITVSLQTVVNKYSAGQQ